MVHASACLVNYKIALKQIKQKQMQTANKSNLIDKQVAFYYDRDVLICFYFDQSFSPQKGC